MTEDRTEIALPDAHFWLWIWYTDGNSRCDASAATIATIIVRNSMYETKFPFVWPDQRHEAEQLLRALRDAHQHGDNYARKDIRTALGVKDPRP